MGPGPYLDQGSDRWFPNGKAVSIESVGYVVVRAFGRSRGMIRAAVFIAQRCDALPYVGYDLA